MKIFDQDKAGDDPSTNKIRIKDMAYPSKTPSVSHIPLSGFNIPDPVPIKNS